MDTQAKLPDGIRPTVPTLNVATAAKMLGYSKQHINHMLLVHKLHGKKDRAGHWRVSARSIATELYWRTETMRMPLPSARFGTQPLRSFAAFEYGLGLWAPRRAPRALVSPDGVVVELIVPTDQEVEFWDQHLGHL